MGKTQPRVWRHGDPEPTGHVRVRDNQGDIWQPMTIAPGLWETPETKPFEWTYVLRKWGPLVEVIESDAGTETEPPRRTTPAITTVYLPSDAPQESQ